MSADVIQFDVLAARRRAERIRLLTGAVAENLAKVRELVHEAKESNDHLALGYDSWTAYIADLFGDEPLRLARDVRRELVAELAEQGMSTRAIAPIVGVSREAVRKDMAGDNLLSPEENSSPKVLSSGQAEGVRNLTPDPTETLAPIPDTFVIDGMTVTSNGDVIDEPAEVTEAITETVKTETKITGLDGKTYKKAEPKSPRRKSIVDDAMKARHDLWAAVTKIQTIMQDDRYNANKAGIQDALHPAARLASEVFANLFDTKESEEI